MADIVSRQNLIDYCLRHLGSPLVEINITEEQEDDCISEAVQYFIEYYFDGIEKMFFKHLVTTDDVTNGYVILPDTIFGVNRVFPTTGTSSSQTNIFDLQYQLRMNDLRDLTSTSMIYYTQVMNHIDLIDQLLNSQPQFRFNRFSNRLYIDQNWSYKWAPGEYIVADCYSALDPAACPRFWGDRLLKKYSSALMKKQWGQNISKFQGITLPGGVTIDGNALYESGKTEQEEVENEILSKLSPLEMVIG